MVGYAKHITAVKAPDGTAPVVHYDVPVNLDRAPAQANGIYILPEQIWSQHEGDDAKEARLFTNEAPIVSGGSTRGARSPDRSAGTRSPELRPVAAARSADQRAACLFV